jgi:hypothetical protein
MGPPRRRVAILRWLAGRMRAWADSVLDEPEAFPSAEPPAAGCGPPAHWVEKVRRFAPELLRPAAPSGGPAPRFPQSALDSPQRGRDMATAPHSSDATRRNQGAGCGDERIVCEPPPQPFRLGAQPLPAAVAPPPQDSKTGAPQRRVPADQAGSVPPSSGNFNTSLAEPAEAPRDVPPSVEVLLPLRARFPSELRSIAKGKGVPNNQERMPAPPPEGLALGAAVPVAPALPAIGAAAASPPPAPPEIAFAPTDPPGGSGAWPELLPPRTAGARARESRPGRAAMLALAVPHSEALPRWPDLPAMIDPSELDSEAVLRAIERRARLLREQRGG